MNSDRPLQVKAPVIILVGPTAVGKTALSFEIVRRFNCEIISMDSMQVYRHMDIGTAKPTEQERQQVRHHLIDIVSPDEQYSAARFIQDCLQAIKKIVDRNKTPLITGGTGLYFSSLINGLFDNINIEDKVRNRLASKLNTQGLPWLYQELCRIDPISAARIHKNDRQRIVRGLEIFAATGIPWSKHIERQKNEKPHVQFTSLIEIGLTCDRHLLYERIEQRAVDMLEHGLVNEVKKLRRDYSASLSSMQALGYRHVNQLLDGRWTENEMKEYLVRDTRRYAKRQITWFRRHGTLCWFKRNVPSEIIKYIECKFKAE